MASGRSSPLRTFKQPLSPKLEAKPQPQSRLRQQRQTSSGSSANQLRLPGLPRFHPANFPSASSSMASTPSGVPTPHGPISPHSQQRQYSEAQRQLLNYQRDSYVHKRSASSTQRPISPRLMPLAGSPGPVTPLELEADNYLTVGSGVTSTAGETDYIDHLIRTESACRAAPSSAASSRYTPVSGY
ncbi:hypothetical protein EJ08DRAFT_402952 [Tothia fuscella]|uniref:Uncharacterized protein n=1 Tax=Tothia fuscella TaxID=1048955 RepID=A0A9P4NKM3_9PEZI|nr:hypothetical protein EJ08DRAFT_402952 [Tothia fuscella]